MRNLLFLLILVIMQAGFPAKMQAQSYHFIYLQSENRQPFYVKLDRQVISSASSGYCIVPKLRNGSYSLIIGFNGKGKVEQVFHCTINDKDAGYLIRDLGEKGWVLFNLQTMETLAAVSKPAEPAAPGSDAFSEMLSTVVNDPTIRQPVKEPVKEPVREPVKEPVKEPAGEPVKDPVKEQPVANKQPAAVSAVPSAEAPKQQDVTGADKEQPAIRPAQRPIVRQLDAVTIDKVLKLTYIDQGPGSADTIEVLLSLDDPVKTEAAKSEEPNSGQAAIEKPIDPLPAVRETVVQTEPGVTANKAGAVEQPTQQPDPRFLPVEVKPAATVADTPATRSVVTPMINSDCRELATEDDFLKLRKKMAAAADDEEMLAAARKIFKTRCFHTEQIKNLGVLFLKDEGRYRFYDLAYPFVSDSHLFSGLESQLSDPYFINRFRAMVRR